MRRGLAPAVLLAVALAAPAQKPPPCPSPADAARLVEHPALRAYPRARVIRTICEDRGKEPPRTLAIAWIVSYETGEAAEVQFAPGSLNDIDVRKMRGRPQSSEDEREEAKALVRELLRVDRDLVVEGGFAVAAPDGAPPGRYLELHVVSADRKRMLAEVIVDLSRRRIAAERNFK